MGVGHESLQRVPTSHATLSPTHTVTAQSLRTTHTHTTPQEARLDLGRAGMLTLPVPELLARSHARTRGLDCTPGRSRSAPLSVVDFEGCEEEGSCERAIHST